MTVLNFEAFPKIPRWSREVCITEKIDGTNASILVVERIMCQDEEEWNTALSSTGAILVQTDKFERVLKAASRNRYISEGGDNYGFWKWVSDNRDTLAWLGMGRHYGEWWGSGIQRRYDLSEKRFSLFNAGRWDGKQPACCHIVPVLFRGVLGANTVEETMSNLGVTGSQASPGYMSPEGIVIYHTASRQTYKKTFESDQEGKEQAAQPA